jgi:membrane associated rhomboid family serine protease
MPRYGQVQVSFGPPLSRMVKYLIIVTSAIFVVTYLLEVRGWAKPVAWFGLTPDLVTHRLFLWQPLTYLFLHGNFWHLLFNMFMLWMFGSELEYKWGHKQFLFYYFLTGMGAGLLDILVHPSALSTTVGCSGAIYGLLMAYGLLFGDRPVLFSFLIPMKVKWMVAIMGVIEFLSALNTRGSAVSHIAHLGGMLFGFLYLRGGSLPYRLQLRYHEWRRARLHRKFEVYTRKHEGKDDAGRWIH